MKELKNDNYCSDNTEIVIAQKNEVPKMNMPGVHLDLSDILCRYTTL